jgi:hypothetical protein
VIKPAVPQKGPWDSVHRSTTAEIYYSSIVRIHSWNIRETIQGNSGRFPVQTSLYSFCNKTAAMCEKCFSSGNPLESQHSAYTRMADHWVISAWHVPKSQICRRQKDGQHNTHCLYGLGPVSHFSLLSLLLII